MNKNINKNNDNINEKETNYSMQWNSIDFTGAHAFFHH